MNYSKFGIFTETGYTINKTKRDEVIRSLDSEIKELPKKINTSLTEAKQSAESDKKSIKTKEKIAKYYLLKKSLEDKTSLKEKLHYP